MCTHVMIRYPKPFLPDVCVCVFVSRLLLFLLWEFIRTVMALASSLYTHHTHSSTVVSFSKFGFPTLHYTIYPSIRRLKYGSFCAHLIFFSFRLFLYTEMMKLHARQNTTNALIYTRRKAI